MKISLLLCAGLFLLCPQALFAQSREPLEVEFGRLAPGEMELLPTGRDSAADAYFLFDREEVEFQRGESLQMIRRVHRRTKLIRESSFDRADVELIYWSEHQDIKQVEAAVHPPGGGVIVLKNADIIEEKLDDDRRVVKFTFPQVAEGAIIEYRYQLTDKYVTVPPAFYFQSDIPIRYTEYTSIIPDFLQYVNLGNATNFTVKKEKDRDGASINASAYRNIRQRLHETTQAYYDVPAYQHQPYVNNFKDFVPHIRYQLQIYRFPDGRIEKVFSDWPETASDMHDWPTFGKAYRSKSLSNAVWKEAAMKVAGLTTEREKAEALYDFVTAKVAWDGDYDYTCDNTPNKVFAAGSGDSGELSLTLLALLNRADIEAQPALVALRGNGSPIQVYPIMSQFQHVIIVAQLDGVETFIDPNDGFRPVGLPRAVALNHHAMVIEKGNPHWVDLTVPPATQTVVANMIIGDDGLADVDITSRLESYFAYEGRAAIEGLEEEDEFPVASEIINRFSEAAVVNRSLRDEDKKNGALNFTLKMSVPIGESLNDYLYLQPVLMTMLDGELKDTDRRLYPVDFAYPWLKRYVSNITIPEGYAVEELPVSTRITSEDESISCLFTTADDGAGHVSVNMTVKMLRTLFQPDEYEVLREMFVKIIEMQETTIVLKKAK
ncbi:DUF3857 domain-containing protein [Neolewinella antarctica]|uniref:Transglutaminase-like putative cysteine protease n=1 Tax=Neolewinella antarctica TaxID=442734 RepID=A0ABX0X7Q2_9BACT|nr:DUF3857 domain-containing protein [Neolewinella antarctica]NJC25033.1 transglutaminase-like putative cysteine protease [Neolewinella antarctica]